MQIKHRITNAVLWESPCSTIRETVVKAVAAKTYLQGADLQGADLQGADLQGADLRGADLQGAEAAIAQTRILPEGAIIGWKKCRDKRIVKLLIPEKARRSHAFGRKCRAEFAKVLAIYDGDKTKALPKSETAFSLYNGSFKYAVGKTVKPESWCEDFTQECAGGIHFFITRLEAEIHDL